MKERKNNKNKYSKKREELRCAAWNTRGWGGKQDSMKIKNKENKK